eukprot:gene14819-16995_t
MPNNPKGHAGNGEYGLRSYFKPGEGHIRECAAYILDYQNFCHVPETAVVHIEHDALNYPRNSKGQMKMYPKLGSLQRFVPAGDTFEDIGHSLVGVLELQKIALLDMRLLNCDRNASNMLAIRKPVVSREKKCSASGNYAGPRKYSRSSSLGTASETYNSDDEMDLDEFLDGPLACSNYSSSGHSSKYSDTYTLVPIDHGYCLPSQLHIDEYDWAWFYCPHVDVEVQPEIKEYMNNLDIEALLADLTAQLPVSSDCLFLLRVAHTLIKEGINAGLTLKEIATMIARVDEDVPSMLETAIANAEDNAQRAIESRAGRRQTTSPAFLKSLEAAQMAMLAQNAVQSAQLQEQEQPQPLGPGVSPVVEADPYQQDGDVGLCLDRDSPESPTICAPPVLVRQRSVGSPRSNGSSSPPQRIGGGHKRIASTPSSYVRDTSTVSVNSTSSKGLTSSGAKWTQAVARTRSCSLEEEIDEFPHTITTSLTKPKNPHTAAIAASSNVAAQGEAGSLFRPCPVRATPDRVMRGISSELNLEALGSPLFEHSPNPYSVDRASRGTSHSLSSTSRSPLPLPPADSKPYKAYRGPGGVSSTQTNIATGGMLNPNLSVNIGYLSSENIQKLQASPSISAAKFPDVYFARSTSRHTSNVSGEHTCTAQAAATAAAVPNTNNNHYSTINQQNNTNNTNLYLTNTPSTTTAKLSIRTPLSPSPFVGNNEQYGDYFMKDLSLLPPSAANEDASLPLHLISSHSACSSPHSAFVMVRPGSRDRLTPRTPTATSSSDKLPATATATSTTTHSNNINTNNNSSYNKSTPPLPAPSSSNTGNVALLSQTKNKNASSANSLASSRYSSQSQSNSSNSGGNASAPIVRPRAGDPIVAMRSFDADYVRVHRPNDYLSHSSSASVLASAGSSVKSLANSPAPSMGNMSTSSQPTSQNSSRTNLASVDNLFSAAAKSAVATSTANAATAAALSAGVASVTTATVSQLLHALRESSSTSNAAGTSAVSSTSLLSGLTTLSAESHLHSHSQQQKADEQRYRDRAISISPNSAPIAIRASLGSCSLFASDSDLTVSHSVATSQESASSISPKQSPKLTRTHSDGFGKRLAQKGYLRDKEEEECGVRASLHHSSSENNATQNDIHTNHTHHYDHNNHDSSTGQMLRDSESSNDAYSPRTINSGSIDQDQDQDPQGQSIAPEWSAEQLLLLDGPIHTVPLKDMHDSTRLNLRTATQEAYDMLTTDTEGEADEPSATRPRSKRTTTTNKTSPILAETATVNALSATMSPVRTDYNKHPILRDSPALSTTTINTTTSTGLRPPGFHRVASFAAFESPPLYSLPKNDHRKGLRLKQEKRKAIALTQEFQDLRLSFCRETINSVLLKAARSKAVV